MTLKRCFNVEQFPLEQQPPWPPHNHWKIQYIFFLKWCQIWEKQVLWKSRRDKQADWASIEKTKYILRIPWGFVCYWFLFYFRQVSRKNKNFPRAGLRSRFHKASLRLPKTMVFVWPLSEQDTFVFLHTVDEAWKDLRLGCSNGIRSVESD